MSRIVAVCFYVAIGLFVLGGLHGADPLGFLVDWNMPFEIQAMHSMFAGTDGFTPWNYANGGTPLFYPTLAPFLLLVSGLSYLIPSVGIMERLLLAFFAMAAAYGMNLLISDYRRSDDRWPAYLAAIVYATGGYVFTKMCQGVLQEVFSYALLPFVAWLLLRAVRARVQVQRTALAMLTGVLIAVAASQTPMAVFAVIVLICAAFIFRAYKLAAVALVTSILCVSYAVLPLAANFHYVASVFSSDTPLSEIHQWAPKLLDALRQSGYTGTFDVDSMNRVGLFAPWFIAGTMLFAFSVVGAWSYGTRASRLLAGGICVAALCAASPRLLPQVYDFVLLHLPGAFVFRESYRFTALLAFGEALGISILCRRAGSSELMAVIPRAVLVAAIFALWVLYPNTPIPFALAIGVSLALEWAYRSAVRRGIEPERILRPATAILLTMVAVMASPFSGAGLAAEVPQIAVPASASAAYNEIAQAPQGGRMLYLPFILPMRAIGSSGYGTDPTISWPPKPTIGNYLPMRISKQFASALYSHDIAQAGMLADWLDFRYVDARSWVKDGLWDNTPIGRTGRFVPSLYTTPTAVAALPAMGFDPVQYAGGDDQERLYRRTRKVPNRVTSFESFALVDGDLRTAALVYRTGNVDAFADQNAWTAVKAMLTRGARTIVEGGEPIGLIATALPVENNVDPGRYATQVDADQGWGNMNAWNSWWWLDHGYVSGTEDAALVARIHSRTLTVPLHAHGSAVLAIKYFAGPQVDTLQVRYGSTHVVLDAKVPLANEGFRWAVIPLSNADPSASVEISNAADGDGVVARVALASSSTWIAAKAQVERLLHNVPTTFVMRPGESRIFIAHASKFTASSMCERSGTRALQIGPYRLSTGAPNNGTIAAGNYRVRWIGPWNTCRAMVLTPVSASARRVAAVDLHPTAPAAYAGRAPSADSVAVINTGYAPAWQMGGNGVHFVADGYANGWIVDHPGPVVIAFGTRRLFYGGLLLSVLTVLASIALLFAFLYNSKKSTKPEESCPELLSPSPTETTPGF